MVVAVVRPLAVVKADGHLLIRCFTVARCLEQKEILRDDVVGAASEDRCQRMRNEAIRLDPSLVALLDDNLRSLAIPIKACRVALGV